MKRVYILHIEELKYSLSELSDRGLFVIAMACAERLWLPYKKASEGKVWNRQQVLRSCVDLAWRSVEDGSIFPPNLEDLCVEAISEENVDQLGWVARDAAVSFYNVVHAIYRHQSNTCLSVAEANLRFLDRFIYEFTGMGVSSNNDHIVDAHPLMKGEMEHQREDINLLRQPVTADLTSKIRHRSSEKSILAGYWFK